MREIRTSGSVRGDRLPLTRTKKERYVELVYSTEFMGKKIFGLTILLCSGIFLLTGCDKNDNNVIKDVSMIIKDGTLTKTGATVIITDNTDKKYRYGEDIKIDKKNNGKWEELPCKTCFFNTVAYYVDENGKLEFDCNWESMYGKLGSGTYRLVKKLDKGIIYTEFIIS